MRSRIAAALLVPLALVACRRTEKPRGSDASTPVAPTHVASTAASASAVPGVASAHCEGAPPAPKPDDSTSSAKSHDGLATVWAETEPSGDDGIKAWLCFERSGKRKVLLQTSPGDGSVETGIADFQDFVFSRDDRVIFFTTDAWAVSRAAHGVEVATGKEYFITDGSIIEELERGPYKGSLYASHFRLDEDHKIGDPGYTGRGVVLDIIDWHGKRLSKVPDEGGDMKERNRVLGR